LTLFFFHEIFNALFKHRPHRLIVPLLPGFGQGSRPLGAAPRVNDHHKHNGNDLQECEVIPKQRQDTSVRITAENGHDKSPLIPEI